MHHHHRWIIPATVVALLATSGFGGCSNGRDAEESPPASVTATSPAPATTETSPTAEAPTVTQASPTPRAATGDPGALKSGQLAVVADEVVVLESEMRGWPILEIVSYDLKNGGIAGAFRVGTVGEHAFRESVRLVGRAVAVNLEQRVILANLDGSGTRTIFTAPEGTVVTVFAASRDQRVMAISVEPVDLVSLHKSLVAFVDIASGTELGRVPYTVMNAPGQGWPPPGAMGWWENGEAVEISSAGPKDFVMGTATIYRDGRVIRHDRQNFGFDPAGGRITFSSQTGAATCEGPVQLPKAIDIVEVPSGNKVGVIAVEGSAVLAARWSPDGAALLFSDIPTGPTASARDCYNWSARMWRLWSPAGIEAVGDVEALLRGWTGDRFVEFACGEERLPWEYPLHAPDLECGPGVTWAPGTLFIGGREIDKVRRATIVGFLE